MNITQNHILIVDDDSEICHLLQDYLCKHDYQVSIAHNGQQMHQQLSEHNIDLIILDVMLPGDDGLVLCQQLVKQCNIPILMLSAQGEATDRIVGLEVGADDYISKPFNPRELLARIKALLRRQDKAQQAATNSSRMPYLQFADWHVDRNRRALINPNKVIVSLTQGEYELLMALLENPQHVLTRNQLLELTRGREAGPLDRTIDVQVGRLRKKIEKDPKQPLLITTVRGGGYQLCCEVKSVSHYE
ncbi:MAG: response regulator [Coxiellaceae bacterium]|nr:response regulator [Coxiellaceae bacterium]